MNKTFQITINEALKTVEASVPAPVSEYVPLYDAFGRVLASDIHCDVALPPCDLSAMDGFACREADRDMPLTVIETVAAGSIPQKKVTAGTCSRIMTGAPVPEGADCVVMFEDTHTDVSGHTITIVNKRNNRNIRFRAEDVGKGDTVLKKGALIGAPHMAILAATGKSAVRVVKRLRVGIIATGDELVEPDKKPLRGQIRNTNSCQLFAQTLRAGALPHYAGIVRDNPDDLDQALRNVLPGCDVLLLSGGVSMGDFDFVPEVFRRNGIRLLFEKIAVKPGKPTVFGTTGKKALFGMPGNPVSAFVIFELLVGPFLRKSSGTTMSPLRARVALEERVHRKKTGRHEFIPVAFTERGTVRPLPFHGSAHIHAFADADGIIGIPAGEASIDAGSSVDVIVVR